MAYFSNKFVYTIALCRTKRRPVLVALCPKCTVIVRENELAGYTHHICTDMVRLSLGDRYRNENLKLMFYDTLDFIIDQDGYRECHRMDTLEKPDMKRYANNEWPFDCLELAKYQQIKRRTHLL